MVPGTVLRRSFAGLSVALLCLAGTAASASPEFVILKQGQQESRLSVEELRQRADLRFSFYDPYLADDVEITGLVFRDLLHETFGEVPAQLRFTAWDDYDVTLGGWDDPNWILVTHHDGEPLTLRQRGPLRLVERDYGSRDPGNLRNFNDWIWMIREVEALP